MNQTMSSKIQPDEPTKKRFELLGRMGDALFQISNEAAGENEYFLAKSAIQEFESEVDKVELESNVLDGVKKVIRYIETKVEKRHRQAENT
jgi:hypothetical protein